jgi:hypothetical protein
MNWGIAELLVLIARSNKNTRIQNSSNVIMIGFLLADMNSLTFRNMDNSPLPGAVIIGQSG